MILCCIKELNSLLESKINMWQEKKTLLLWSRALSMWRLPRPLTFQRVAKKGGFRATYFPKTVLPSTQPTSLLPSASYRPAATTKKISQNIYRRAPIESHRTVDDFQAPDRRCAHCPVVRTETNSDSHFTPVCKREAWRRKGAQHEGRPVLLSHGTHKEGL